MVPQQIYLSPPHLERDDIHAVVAAAESGWIAPAGPELGAFEREFCVATGNRYAVAVNSCTSALHLALLLSGVGPGDEVLCSTFTFVASANPILYVRARPVFVDSELRSWNLDPAKLEETIRDRIRNAGRPPRALVLVHVYGQSADIDAVEAICQRFGVVLIEDAAECLGCIYKSRTRGEVSPGSVGFWGAYSFNGNKIVTSSGGGILTCSDSDRAARAEFLATQARNPGSEGNQSILGYNYRMSNLLAALGRAQLRHLSERIEARRTVFSRYRSALSRLPGIGFMPEAPWCRSTRWLTCITVDPEAFGTDRDAIRNALAEQRIESRPVWKPLHQQPLFKGFITSDAQVSEAVGKQGLCLPSGSNLSDADVERVVNTIASLCTKM